MIADPRAKQKFDPKTVCGRCLRPKEACLCGRAPLLDNKIRVVILQHPQEQYKALNSARLAHLMLKNSALFVGLSWPNFRKVAPPGALPSEWGVLFLKGKDECGGRPLAVLNRKSGPVDDTSFLRGIVALDGSWKQAKALWWRNPWLLRLNRISLRADHPSLRPQAKTGALSTIEAIAFALEHLGDGSETAGELRSCYRREILEPAGAAGAADAAAGAASAEP